MTDDTARRWTARHGTTIGHVIEVLEWARTGHQHKDWNGKLVDLGSESLYVTDSQEQATAYANAQSTGEVKKAAKELAPGAAIITFDLPTEPAWRRRPDSHNTLDTAEANISGGARVSKVEVRLPEYENNTGLQKLRRYQAEHAGEFEYSEHPFKKPGPDGD